MTTIHFPKILLPSLVGVSVYLLVNRFFPEELEKVKNVENKPDSVTGLRGGSDTRSKLVNKIVRDHELDLHAQSIRSLIIHKSLTDEQKISLLRIKLDYIIK